MRKIATVCLKGGSSKTTTTTALAVGLARAGRRTLVIDCDGQANATWTLSGGQGADDPTLAEVLTRQASAAEAIRPTTTEGLDLLPAGSALGGVNVRLATEPGRDARLRTALASVEGLYDFVLLDTGPSVSTVWVNALVYAREVLSPLDPGIYAVLGLVELERTVAELAEAYNPGLRISGLLLTKVQRNNVARDVEAGLRSRYGPLVYGVTIPHNVAVDQAHTHGMTVIDHAPKSAAALAYLQLVSEVIGNGDRAEGRGGVDAVGRPGRRRAGGDTSAA